MTMNETTVQALTTDESDFLAEIRNCGEHGLRLIQASRWYPESVPAALVECGLIVAKGESYRRYYLV